LTIVYPGIHKFPEWNSPRGYPMSAAYSFVENARKSFRLAAEAIPPKEPKEAELYARVGRDYLKLAQNAPKVDDKPSYPLTSWAP
jgi:hypothetical protein